MKKTIILAASTIFLGYFLMAPTVINADTAPQGIPPRLPVVTISPKAYPMRVTAYSSSRDETDSTPFTTATGMMVRDGIVATNILPFGTKIKIPALFGNKIFTVEDRMNRRLRNVIDVWMPTKSAALKFGVNYAEVVIVSNLSLSRK